MSRTSRGLIHDRSCRAGCNAPETLNHVLQTCHRTHYVRIRCHDAVVACLVRGLEKRKYRVTREAEFCNDEGVGKPDLIATKMGRSIVIDAEVVNDQTIVDRAHKRKAEYYSANTSLRRAIATKCGTEVLQFISATLSWRGLWSARTAKDLLKSGFINKSDLKVISSRVFAGGVAASLQ